jgi:hypothetical protein
MQEKIRPIDKKLHYQIEKLLAAAAVANGRADGAAGEDGAADLGADPLSYGPRPGSLVAKAVAGGGVGTGEGTGAEAGATGAYRPPRLNPVSMELEEEERGAGGKERRRLAAQARRASRSNLVRFLCSNIQMNLHRPRKVAFFFAVGTEHIHPPHMLHTLPSPSHQSTPLPLPLSLPSQPQVQELAAELSGAPEELRESVAGMDTAAAVRERRRLAAREEVEEELMVRHGRRGGKCEHVCGASMRLCVRADLTELVHGTLELQHTPNKPENPALITGACATQQGAAQASQGPAACRSERQRASGRVWGRC